jgi:hypothetical protein
MVFIVSLQLHGRAAKGHAGFASGADISGMSLRGSLPSKSGAVPMSVPCGTALLACGKVRL